MCVCVCVWLPWFGLLNCSSSFECLYVSLVYDSSDVCLGVCVCVWLPWSGLLNCSSSVYI